MCLAIPGQVIELIDPVNQIAKVDVVGVRRNINVSLLSGDGDGSTNGDGKEGVRPGDWVLIHVGFAISRIDEDEAHATRALLEQMGQEYEQELEELKASVID
jgi:hydrogenase expression/formation protein HypC